MDRTSPSPAPDGKGRAWIKLLLKAGGSLALIALVLHQEDLGRIAGALAEADLRLVALAFSLNITGFLFSVLRWNVLLRALGARVRLLELSTAYLTGIFFGCFLPGFLLGSDVVRAQATVKAVGSATQAYLTVAIDRFTGLIVFAAFAAGAVVLGGAAVAGLGVAGPIAAFLIAVVLIGLALYLPVASRLIGLAASHPRLARVGLFQKAKDGLDMFRARPRSLAQAMGWAVLLQLNVILYYALIGRALGLQPGLAAFFIAVPIVLSLLMLPITINGVGLREQLFMLLLGPFGVPGAQAVALAWIDLGLYLAIGLIGGLVFVLGRRRPAAKGAS